MCCGNKTFKLFYYDKKSKVYDVQCINRRIKKQFVNRLFFGTFLCKPRLDCLFYIVTIIIHVTNVRNLIQLCIICAS